MVSSTRTASRLMIIARPNQSATWSDNVLLLLALSVPVLGIAVVFALLGAWLILPFAGLELLALGAALTITSEAHPWDGPELCVHDRNESVTLGAFLSREDSLKLIALLQQEIRVCARCARTLREF